MLTCPKCRNDCLPTWTHCPACGSRLPRESARVEAQVDAGGGFKVPPCPSCGFKMRELRGRLLNCPECGRSTLAGESLMGPLFSVVWEVVGPDVEVVPWEEPGCTAALDRIAALAAGGSKA